MFTSPVQEPSDLGRGGHDDVSSGFLSSSKESIPEASEDAAEDDGHDEHDVLGLEGLQRNLQASLGSLRASVRYPEPVVSVRRPLLWRLFPRCIRATEQEVCIAAEVTLSSAPSDCSVTATKEGRPLPVRIDFLNDRQATGDDSDQPSRHGRGPVSAPDAASRRAARELLQALRPQRPDSELVLIWLTPGTAPGLVLIELHTRVPGAIAGAHDGDSAPLSHNEFSVASTGALLSAWRTPAHVLGSSGVGVGRAISTGVAGAISAVGDSFAGQQSLHGGAALLLTSADVGRGAAANATLPLTASLHGARALALSGPASLHGQRGNGFGAGPGPGRLSVSSGALSLVIVPDAGIEAEVCELLALQHQQTPLPVPGGDNEGPAAAPTDAYGRTRVRAQDAQAAPAGAAASGSGGGPSPGCDEDSDDARARERFLWDLGAWLELSVEHAAARESGAAGLGAAGAGRDEAARAGTQRDLYLVDLQHLGSRSRHQPPPLQRGDAASTRMPPSIRAPEPSPEIEPYVAPVPAPDPHRRVAARAAAAAADVCASPPPRVLGRALLQPPEPPLGDPSHVRSEQPQAPPVPRAALELLGFACSRGWAATSSHIVLGLLDMGHTMRDINAAVQAAHGWSALHLAAASGSAELVAMTALWRSYARYGDGGEATEEWRAMLATPGPGGLTPLHLAAVLPAPAAAAVDLLSSLPAESLSTWFGVAARDGCTPAHYASRAGNAHLNNHALLCLATGCAELEDLDAGAAQGLQEVLNLGDLHLDLDGSSVGAASESVDAESLRQFPVSGNAGSEDAPLLPPQPQAGSSPASVDEQQHGLAAFGGGGGGGGEHHGGWDGVHRPAGAAPRALEGRPPGAPVPVSATAAASALPYTPFRAAGSLHGLSHDIPLGPGRMQPAEETWLPEPWQPQRRLWPQPTHFVADLLGRVSPVVSGHGSVVGSSPASSATANHAHAHAEPLAAGRQSAPGPSFAPTGPPSAQQQHRQHGNGHHQGATMSLEDARRAACWLIAAAARAATSAPAAAAAARSATSSVSVTPTASASVSAASVGSAAEDAIGAAAAAPTETRSAPSAAGGRLLAGLAGSPGGLAHMQRQAAQQRHLVQQLMRQQLHHLQPGGHRQPGSLEGEARRQAADGQSQAREGETTAASAEEEFGAVQAQVRPPPTLPWSLQRQQEHQEQCCPHAVSGAAVAAAGGGAMAPTPVTMEAAAASGAGALAEAIATPAALPQSEATCAASIGAADEALSRAGRPLLEPHLPGPWRGTQPLLLLAGASLAVALAYGALPPNRQGSILAEAFAPAALGWAAFGLGWPLLNGRAASAMIDVLLGQALAASGHAAWLALCAAAGLPASVLAPLAPPLRPRLSSPTHLAPQPATAAGTDVQDARRGGAVLAAGEDVLAAFLMGLLLRTLLWLAARSAALRGARRDRGAGAVSRGARGVRAEAEPPASIIDIGGNRPASGGGQRPSP